MNLFESMPVIDSILHLIRDNGYAVSIHRLTSARAGGLDSGRPFVELHAVKLNAPGGISAGDARTTFTISTVSNTQTEPSIPQDSPFAHVYFRRPHDLGATSECVKQKANYSWLACHVSYTHSVR